MSLQYPNILIVGPSGSGKSSCLRNLNPEETGIVNGERKALPFKNAKSFLKEVECNNLIEYTNGIRKFVGDTSVKQIIVESFTSFDEACLAWCRASYKGYDIYSVHNSMVRDFIKESKLKDKICIFTGIDEIVGIETPTGGKVSRRALKVEGRELQGTIEKEFTIVLFTEVIKQGDVFKYMLRTNTDGICSAKSPLGMFSSILIDNDLSLVINTVKKYYE